MIAPLNQGGPRFGRVAMPAEVLHPMFNRDGLPECVRVTLDVPAHGIRRNDTFVWSATRKAYVNQRNQMCVLAGAVRDRFGVHFVEAQPVREQIRLALA